MNRSFERENGARPPAILTEKQGGHLIRIFETTAAVFLTSHIHIFVFHYGVEPFL